MFGLAASAGAFVFVILAALYYLALFVAGAAFIGAVFFAALT